VIRVYDEAGNVIETHEHAGEFEEPWASETKSRHALKRDGSLWNAACFVRAGADLGMYRVFNPLRIQRSLLFARHRLALTLARYNLSRCSQSEETVVDRLLPIPWPNAQFYVAVAGVAFKRLGVPVRSAH